MAALFTTSKLFTRTCQKCVNWRVPSFSCQMANQGL